MNPAERLRLNIVASHSCTEIIPSAQAMVISNGQASDTTGEQQQKQGLLL